MDREVQMSARDIFYIFVNTSDANRFCAVRQDQSIPAMLDGVHWSYAGFTDNLRSPPLGFDLDKANGAMSRRGIYFYRREFIYVRGSLREAA
jgi:hypothetical protein